MKKGAVITIIIIVIIVLLAVWWISAANMNPSVSTTGGTPTSTATGTGTSALSFDKTLSDSTITIAYPSAIFGLATNQQQVTVTSYIPPCDQGFNYCLYYNTTTYAGTNFETAGIAVKTLPTLTTQSKCLNTQPTGYTGLKPTIATSSEYAVSEFGSPSSPISNAAAGHFANDIIYRLAYNGSCYEFDTRVGESDYLNYPSGSIQQFTSSNQADVETLIGKVLATLKLPDGTVVAFPQ